MENKTVIKSKRLWNILYKVCCRLTNYQLRMLKIQVLFFPILLVISVSSCFSPEDGCLDIEATNFDASADENCSDCCTYPQLRFTFSHQMLAKRSTGVQDSCCMNHSQDSTFDNSNNTLFLVKDMQFYLSDFQLVRSDGTVEEVIDTITVNILDDLINLTDKDTLVKDDFVLIERSITSSNVGEFRGQGTFEKVRFNIGIDDRLTSTDYSLLSSTHALALTSDTLHTLDRSIGYILQRFTLVRDTTTSPEEDQIDLTKINFSEVQVELAYDVTVEPGFNVTIPLKINYSKWLEGINFVADSELDIKSKIVSNTAEAFEINQ